jgi:hypothetical protein
VLLRVPELPHLEPRPIDRSLPRVWALQLQRSRGELLRRARYGYGGRIGMSDEKEECSVCGNKLSHAGVHTVIWKNRGYAHKRHDSQFKKAKKL